MCPYSASSSVNLNQQAFQFDHNQSYTAKLLSINVLQTYTICLFHSEFKRMVFLYTTGKEKQIKKIMTFKYYDTIIVFPAYRITLFTTILPYELPRLTHFPSRLHRGT